MWDFTTPRKIVFGEDALEYLMGIARAHERS